MHYLSNFKGLAEVRVNLFSALAVLIGRNAAGKTNLIEGVELLSGIANGISLHDISEVDRGGKLEVRGGLQACPTFGRSDFTLGFNAKFQFDGRLAPLMYRITIGTDPVRVRAEELRLDNGDTLIFETVDGSATSLASGDIKVAYNNFARGGTKPQRSVSAGRSVLSQYETFIDVNKKKIATVGLVRRLREYLRQSFIFDPVPRLMRSYNRVGDDVLRRDGSNLSATLYGLRLQNPDALERILARVRSIPDAPVDDFDFVTTRLGDVMFGLKERGRASLSDARLLSDGTLRAIAVLAALETAKPNSRVVIEELDNGLHPSRVRTLLDAIHKYTGRGQRSLNILVTTHNPATLNALSDEQLDSVSIAAHRTQDGPAEIIRLRDIPRYEELLERGGLGDLVTEDIVKRYLDPAFEKQRKQDSLQWLQRLGQ